MDINCLHTNIYLSEFSVVIQYLLHQRQQIGVIYTIEHKEIHTETHIHSTAQLGVCFVFHTKCTNESYFSHVCAFFDTSVVFFHSLPVACSTALRVKRRQKKSVIMCCIFFERNKRRNKKQTELLFLHFKFVELSNCFVFIFVFAVLKQWVLALFYAYAFYLPRTFVNGTNGNSILYALCKTIRKYVCKMKKA